jgi:apolipoprotein N-acyltransferase
VALLPLLVAIARTATSAAPRTLRPFLLGLLTGVVYFCGTLYWLTDVMVVFGGLSTLAAAAVALLLIAYLSLFPAVFAHITAHGVRWLGPRALLAAPLVWVAAEFARGHLLTGFPWVPLGNSQVNVGPVLQVASLVGVYGLSGMVAFPAAALAYASVTRDRTRFWPAIAIGALVVAAAGWGARRIADGRLVGEGQPVRVGLVQGNVEQGHKWDPAYAPQIFARYMALSSRATQSGARLVLWPESSTPFMFEEDVNGAEAIRRLARETGTTFLVGSNQVERGTPPRYYNAAFLVDADGRTRGVYRKMHLVPFGEYVPLARLLFFVAPVVEAVGTGFAAGDEITVFAPAGGTFSTAICYEVVFPELARDAVLRGSRLLSTITNDAWYGFSSAPYQHFEQARVRAVETGRYLVRAANTGISGIVDPYGRVVISTGLFEEAVAVGEARYLDGLTLYVRIGDACAWAGVGLALVLWAGGVGAARRTSRGVRPR